jgi:hypothetical protein
MDVLLIVILITIAVIAIPAPKRGYRGIVTRKCPQCRNLLHAKASVCKFCHTDVEPERWIWQKLRNAVSSPRSSE